MKKMNLKKIILAALFAALIVVMTAYVSIKIPVGSSGGYIHVGDSIIYLAGCLLGPYGAVAAAVGGALADILAGAAAWAPATAIIKPCNCIPFILATYFYVKRKGTHKIFHLSTVLMTLVSGAITVLGYFLAEGLMYSFASALASVPFNVLQAVGSAVIFMIVAKGLDIVEIQKHIR